MKIYFMGVCGTAMGNVAVMMKSLGHDVSGSDTGVYEPMKGVLERAGIAIFDGWDPARLEALAPDLVVVGNVISRMNPELEWLWNGRRFPHVSLAELVGSHVIGRRPSLVVGGTHGKTTTTSIAAYLLDILAPGSGWMIGGVPRNLGAGASFGAPDSPFAIEGDEYDTAFFDKRSKFIHYRPRVLLVNNVEFDHADIFRDIADVKRTFTHVRRIVAGGGMIVENGDDANIAALEDTPWVRRMKVGFGAGCDLRISDFREDCGGSSFSLSFGGASARVGWALQGEFNARNAAMALAGVSAILGMGGPLDIDAGLLSGFRGVARRQELILDSPRVKAVEDFGHHPTAIRATLESVRRRFEGFRVYACFEPRSNTAKTNVFEREFGESLGVADMAFLGAAPGLSKIAEDRRISTARIAEAGGEGFMAFEKNEDLLATLVENVKNSPEKIVCVFFSNGSFDGIHKKFAEIFGK